MQGLRAQYVFFICFRFVSVLDCPIGIRQRNDAHNELIGWDNKR